MKTTEPKQSPRKPPAGYRLLTLAFLKKHGAVKGMMFWNYLAEYWSGFISYKPKEMFRAADIESWKKQPWCAPVAKKGRKARAT